MDNPTKHIVLRLRSLAERQLLIGIETSCTYANGVIEEITDDGAMVCMATNDGKRCWIRSDAILAFDVNERMFQSAYTPKEKVNDNQATS